MKDYKFIYMTEIPNEGKKTRKFQVVNKRTDFILGEIKFYGAWFTYCFYPAPDCLFNIGCMEDIIDFIRGIKSTPHQKRSGK